MNSGALVSQIEAIANYCGGEQLHECEILTVRRALALALELVDRHLDARRLARQPMGAGQ